MSNTPKTIYRNPNHAGTKPVMHNGLPMRTLDPQRLARAGAVSKPVRRRGLSNRTVLLSFLGLLVVIALLAIATSGGGHA